MGHFYTEVTATGRNRRDAEAAAVADFLFENGHRHSLREVTKPRLLRKVPPKVWREFTVPASATDRRLGIREYVTCEQVENHNVPLSEWMEEWQFTLHTHA